LGLKELADNRRLELKLTQKALAALFEVCVSTIVRWEGGTEQPLKNNWLKPFNF